MAALHDAGYDDVLPAHLGVFQHPGPHGQRPGVLAVRASASKQAMNHLLHQLETGGYLTRQPSDRDRRTRVICLTARGWAVQGVILDATWAVDREWRELVGEDYDTFRLALERLESSLGT